MSRKFYVNTLYRVNEEVMGFRVLYKADGASNRDAQQLCRDLSELFAGRFVLWDPVFAGGVNFIGVEVSSPAEGSLGSASHTFSENVTTSTNDSAAPDSVIFKVGFGAVRPDTQRTSSLLKVSGVPRDQILANGVVENWADTMETAMQAYYPFVIPTSSGDANLIIESTIQGVEQDAVVDSIRVDRILGSHIERVGDRAQGRPSRP